MKKFNIFFYLTAICAVLALSSCEGPMGPAGADGTNGTDGIDGTNGTNGTAVCQACHAGDQVMLAKVQQYNNSFHANGENAAYANNSSAACTQCHVSQGFVDYIKNNKTPNTVAYLNPLQPNCYTCHKVHTTFTTSDWDLTTTAAVTMTHGGASYNKGNSNICANCHQARALSPAMPTVGSTDAFVISSSQTRWGTHHGPMANVLLGAGMFEVAGTVSYATNVHGSIAQGCVQCHMSDPYGTSAGGHQMGMEYDSHGTALINVKGCSPCHPNGTSAEQTTLRTKISTFQATTQALLTQLETLLINQNVYNSATGLMKAGTFTANQGGAYLNYQTIKEDKSLGVHNPQYTKALLQNSIEAID